MFGGHSSTPFGGGGGAGGFGNPPQQNNPFGAAPAAGAFGSPPPSGFGSASAQPFGSAATTSTFGSAAASTFGSPPAFGSAPSTGGLFGSATPAAGGGGAFGSSAFGAPAPATAPLFGAPAPAATGFFGGGAAPTAAPAATPFGSAVGGFGSATSTFGTAAAPSTGLFGSPSNVGGGTSFFGSAAAAAPAAPATSLFGAPAPAAPGSGGGGTRNIPYAPTSRADGTSNILLHSISAMAPYEDYMFEELRVQDYMAGNRGSASPSAPGGMGLGMAGVGSNAPTPTAGNASGFGFGGAPAGGGLFGSAAPAPASAFGATAGFGAGAAAGTTGLFGSTGTTAFGAPAAAAPSTSLFGMSAPSPSPFGTAGAFGAPAPSTSLFGSPSPTSAAPGSFFGGTAPVPGPSAFGSTSAFGGPTASTGLFGAPAPAGSFGGGFGSTAGGGSAFGANPAGAGGGLFGSSPAPAPAQSLFGTTPAAPAFGSTAPAPSAFGGGFGATAAAPRPLFGAAPSPAPSAFGGGGGLFGSSPAPAPSAFGGTSLFGAPASAPGAGLFGAAPAPAAPAPSLFGGGGFGAAPAPAAPSLFGGAPGFGAAATPAPASTGGFFGSAPAAGATPAPLFGAAPFSGGLFGGAAPTPAAPYSQPTPYGVAAAQFGAPTPGGAVMLPMGYPSPNTNIVPPVANQVLEQQLRALQAQKEEVEKGAVWKNLASSGGTPSPSGGGGLASTPTSTYPDQSSTGAFSFSAYTPMSMASPRSAAARIRPRGSGSGALTGPRTEPRASASSGVGSGHRRWLQESPGSSPPRPETPESYWLASSNRLRIRPDSMSSGRKPLRLQLAAQNLAAAEAALAASGQAAPSPAPAPAPAVPAQTLVAASPPAAPATARAPGLAAETITSPPRDGGAAIAVAPATGTTPGSSTAAVEAPPPPDQGREYYQRLLGGSLESPPADAAQASAAGPSTPAGAHRSHAPTLTNPEYVVHPSLETLRGMTEAELASVSNFSVSRPSEGRVEWIGSVDVRGADLDRIVHISRGDISVYSADEADGTKPPEGTKLNRPAVLTFANVFPDAGPGPWSEEDFARLRRKLVKSAKKTDSTFLSYDENLGEWKIQVKHFSRYGICDSDDEDDGDRDNEEREDGSSSTSPADFRPSPANANKRVRLDLPPPAQLRVAADVRAEEGTVMTIEEMQETEGVSSQMGAVVDLFPRALTPEHTAPSVTFADRGEDAANRTAFIDEWFEPLPLFRARRPSLSERLAQQLELHKTSVDMGWINRRSFRVGWLPNGSFLKCDGARVVSARPAHFAFRGTNSQIRLLEIQKRLSQTTQKGPAPAYAFPSVCDAKEEVHASLQSLIGATDSIDEASLSFSLLASYLQAQSESEIVAAARHVLEDALYAEVSQEVGNAANEGNSLLAAVRALESGNTALACRTSAEAGLFELSTLLSSGVKAGKADLSLQMQQVASLGSLASLSPEVRRIAGLFGGDGSRSGDWRRRLAVRLLQQPDEPLSVAIGDIGESSKKSCLLQILRLISGTCGADVAEIVDPTGLGLDPHDFSLSFHVASILSCFQLSSLVASSLPVQEALCDSFASQLESCGLWEWAVFVTLFWIREGGDARGRLYRAKQTRAKELILRHFSTENANASSSRQFLQRIGLPWQWFEEALAYRCAHSGDVEQCVIHLFEADRKWAVQLLETMLLPRVYFFRGEADFRRMAQAFSDLPPDSLIASVSQLFSLEASIANLANMTDADQCRSELSLKQRELQILEDSLLLLSRVQSRAMAHQQVTLLRSTPTVPLAAVLSSCLERLRVQKDRVRALRQLTDPNRIY